MAVRRGSVMGCDKSRLESTKKGSPWDPTHCVSSGVTRPTVEDLVGLMRVHAGRKFLKQIQIGKFWDPTKSNTGR